MFSVVVMNNVQQQWQCCMKWTIFLEEKHGLVHAHISLHQVVRNFWSAKLLLLLPQCWRACETSPGYCQYIPCFAGLYLLHFSQAVVLHEVDNLLQSLAVHAHIFTQFLSTLVEFLKECKMAPVPHADDEFAVSLLDIIWISSLHPMLCRLVFFFASRNSQKIWFRDVMRCSAWCAREVSTDKECVSDASGQQEPFEVWCKQSFEIRWLGPI